MPREIPASLKRKRKRAKKAFLKFFIVLLVCFVFFAASGALLFSLDSLKIKRVSVLGAQPMLTKGVKAEVENFLAVKFLGIIPKDRVFYFDFVKKKLIAAVLPKFPQIKSIEAENNFSSDLIVRVEERKPAALLCQNQEKECFYLDENGFVFNKAPYFSSGVFVKISSENKNVYQAGVFVCPSDIFRKIMGLKKRLETILPIKEIRLREKGLVELYTEAGPYFIVNISNNPDKVFKNFSVFYDEFLKNQNLAQMEYIDLRFGNKIYYK